MGQYGRKYALIDVAKELAEQGYDLQDDSIEGVSWLFNMHMSFDHQSSGRIEDLVETFGHAIATREHAELAAILKDEIGTDEQEEEFMDACHFYGQRALVHLTNRWLLLD